MFQGHMERFRITMSKRESMFLTRSKFWAKLRLKVETLKQWKEKLSLAMQEM